MRYISSRKKNAHRVLVGKPERDNLKHVGVRGSRISKLTLKKYDGGPWTGLVLKWIRTRGGCL
jgi:hypothetical protein